MKYETMSRFVFIVIGVILILHYINIGIIYEKIDKLESQFNEHITHHNNVQHVQYDLTGVLGVEAAERIEEEWEEARDEQTLLPLGTFTATAYTLGKESTGKIPTDPTYGITKNGFDLRGHTRETANVIAVDRNVIPLGSEVYIEFEDEYADFNGTYKAEDIGSDIIGNRIDVFIPDLQEAKQFGVRVANVYLIGEDDV